MIAGVCAMLVCSISAPAGMASPSNPARPIVATTREDTGAPFIAEGRSSSRFRKFVLHRFFVGEELLNAGALLHARKMRAAMFELRELELELRCAAETPEEMRVRRREVIEEELAFGEYILGDPELLEDLLAR